ncbi:MAG: DUF983 domain-containing protein [Chloroflexi bacterium AL-W]|nr:DUF983 domain-containing protein [Chloroflexi bacterium AL-N1]NOK69221.1 DUF983 domain-containing protein [Chloroflexi bacterium AL-N10]NOK77204.1 DUF983 domain-containing protein [Chloroflexi bacterium AL-N5]NOK83849.1 DUF983 domain-containing protein [Chloroflexi bacterium AL-W]NOK91059.1 DUF983 domain-containing protein [Chloroflexi bacterium AL-N15]
MWRFIRAMFDGLFLRCPSCHKGAMFRSFSEMNQQCAHCGNWFERSSGEITGGMGINIVVTLLLVIMASAIVGFSTLPVLPSILTLGVATILFPILFYPISRGLWASLIYLTGDNEEPDEGMY